MPDESTLDILRQEAVSLVSQDNGDALLDLVGEASLVLLGEATHGTEEFYRMRARFSERLIRERGFDAIAVEADWPDALRVNRYLNPAAPPADRRAEEALGDFRRFPLWMWRNTETAAFIERLRIRNLEAGPAASAGFFGLDLYSLRRSMEAVVRYLSAVDPEAARQARARYGCFDHLAEDPQRYGYAASFGMGKDCEEEVVRQLVALSTEAGKYASADDPVSADELFYAQQNALVARNAEGYYRAMFAGRNASWNLRDTHMADTLDALRRHIGARKGRPAKIIVWAHNSHLGDARATEMGEQGQINLGQLVRERHGPHDSFLLGFTTHAGTVTAASEWDGPAERKKVRPSLPGSIERLLHDTGVGDFLLPLRGRPRTARALGGPLLERAIGVLYLPHSERASHYFHADAARQFDALVHIDETHALAPLDRSAAWTHDELPDTYPSGI